MLQTIYNKWKNHNTIFLHTYYIVSYMFAYYSLYYLMHICVYFLHLTNNDSLSWVMERVINIPITQEYYIYIYIYIYIFKTDVLKYYLWIITVLMITHPRAIIYVLFLCLRNTMNFRYTVNHNMPTFLFILYFRLQINAICV